MQWRGETHLPGNGRGADLESGMGASTISMVTGGKARSLVWQLWKLSEEELRSSAEKGAGEAILEQEVRRPNILAVWCGAAVGESGGMAGQHSRSPWG